MYPKPVLPIVFCTLILMCSCAVPVQKDLVPEAEAKSLSEVFRRVNPAVVIVLTKEIAYSRMEPGTMVTRGGFGSGVVISKDGLIMTAAHVVQVADAVAVRFQDGRTVEAKVVGASMQADVALLRLDSVPYDLVTVELGNSNLIDIGDEVFVVGAPYGVDHTLTVGYLSGRRMPRSACRQLVPIEFLQTDAAINQGNSGGPMFSVDGKLIGIVSHIMTRSGGSEGLGFAISSNSAKALLLEQKSFWIGLDAYFVSGELATALNVPQDAGLLVQRIANGSPGAEMGLTPGTIPVKVGREEVLLGGDIILEVQGQKVSTDVEKTCRIRDTIGALQVGSRIEMKVLRGGKIVTLHTQKLDQD
jgi:S1-C subfamily serine protease